MKENVLIVPPKRYLEACDRRTLALQNIALTRLFEDKASISLTVVDKKTKNLKDVVCALISFENMRAGLPSPGAED